MFSMIRMTLFDISVLFSQVSFFVVSLFATSYQIGE